MAFAYQCDECNKQSIGEGTVVEIIISNENAARDRIIHFCKDDDGLSRCFSGWYERSKTNREHEGKSVWIGDR